MTHIEEDKNEFKKEQVKVQIRDKKDEVKVRVSFYKKANERDEWETDRVLKIKERMSELIGKVFYE